MLDLKIDKKMRAAKAAMWILVIGYAITKWIIPTALLLSQVWGR